MSLQTHLAELQRRHETLEREINDAMAHPSVTDERIADLKRKKLALKDEISRLNH